jgi:anthranilate synthase component 2
MKHSFSKNAQAYKNPTLPSLAGRGRGRGHFLMKILIFDNYDSFTYNLVHLVKELGYKEIEVHRNDRITLDEVEKFDKIILSPGPGIPSEAGLLLPLIQRFSPTKSILGVCLGHQAITEAFGGQLINLEDVYHGVATPVKIIAQHRIFTGLPETFEVGRYHSWIAGKNAFPDELEITAIDEEGHIMALKHKVFDVHGVQFHPESVLTPLGKEIMKQFLTPSHP